MSLGTIAVDQVKEEGLYLVYGQAGTGKTSIANYLAVDGKTAVITFDKSHSVLLDGMKAGAIEVLTLDAKTDFMEANYQATLDSIQQATQGFKYVIFDNLSALEYELTADPMKTFKIRDGRQAWQVFQNEMFYLCQLAVELDAICFATAWEMQGQNDFGMPIAKPQLNHKVSGIFAGLAQAVLRTKVQDGAYMLECDPSSEEYYGKNRKNKVYSFHSADILQFLAN